MCEIACPPEHAPAQAVLAGARKLAERTGAELHVVRDPRVPCPGRCRVRRRVGLDGRGALHDRRRRALAPYQVTRELMQLAAPDAIFLHSLPAKRGEEGRGLRDRRPAICRLGAVGEPAANRAALLLTLLRGFEPGSAPVSGPVFADVLVGIDGSGESLEAARQAARLVGPEGTVSLLAAWDLAVPLASPTDPLIVAIQEEAAAYACVEVAA